MNAAKPVFKPIKAKRTFEEVSDHIKEQILTGVFKPGDRLPPEGELATQFGLGRQTIREALRLLEHSGFITVQKGGGGGVIIRDTVVQRIGGLFLDACRVKRISVEALTEARVEIEQVVLKHAIENADDSDIALLRENVMTARKKIQSKLLATHEDFIFHKLLAEATKNPVFVMVMESLMAVHSALLNRVTLKTSEASVVYHEKILEVIEARDHDKAQRLMREHILEVGERICAPAQVREESR